MLNMCHSCAFILIFFSRNLFITYVYKRKNCSRGGYLSNYVLFLMILKIFTYLFTLGTIFGHVLINNLYFMPD